MKVMARKKSLNQLRKHRDVLQYPRPEGTKLRHGKRHDILYNDKGRVAVPRHPGDLKRGTMRSIVKGLIAIGFTGLIIAMVMQIL
jgi:hypothetical protein